jgi:hypothetical protein
MSTERTPAKRFRAFALNCGTNENDPSLLQAVQALRKFELGDATAEEVDSAVGPLFEAWYKAARDAPPHAVAMPAESNSMKAMPLRCRTDIESNVYV